MAILPAKPASRYDTTYGIRGGNPYLRTIFNGVSANGFGTAIETAQLVNVNFYIFTSGNANLTIKLWGSISPTEPVWADGASENNIMSTIYMWDEADPESQNVKGNTGIVLSGTDIARDLMANVNNRCWMNMEISGYAAGTVWIFANGSNNQ